MKKILFVAGTRPNFIKVSPLIKALQKEQNLNYVFVHTGQHYDEKLSQLFLKELKLPKPDYNLKVRSDTHAVQTAKILQRFEPILLEENPDLVIVVGDVNSTLACALVAAKLNFKIAHIESGLRSFDKKMPEEINRLLTDHLSDFLFVTEQRGVYNLQKENISGKKIYFVGDVMVDNLLKSKVKSQKSKILNELNLREKKYALITLHRPSNVDSPENLTKIITIFGKIQKKVKLIFPIHPRTRKRIKEFKLEKNVRKLRNLLIIPAQGYLEFIKLMQSSKFILTDSGDIQVESTVLNIPCLTIRKNTERPATIKRGTNLLVGRNKKLILEKVDEILEGDFKKTNKIPQFWDGKAAERIVKILKTKI